MMRAKIVAVAALVASCGSSDAEKWANFTVKVVQSNIKTTFDGQFLELTIEPSSPAVVAVVPPAPLRWAGRKPGELDKFYLDKGDVRGR